MNKKDSKILEDWNSKADELYNENKLDEIKNITQKLIESNKSQIHTSELGFHLLKEMVLLNITQGQFIEAEKWAKELVKFDFKKAGRPNDGEMEFYLGILYYNIGDKEKCVHYFSIADNKSNGRCFDLPEGQDYKKKFKKLVSKIN